jgi:hypothetical protein
MSETARILDIPGVGRTILYRILRKVNVLDNNNQPLRKYVDHDYLRCAFDGAQYVSKGTHMYVPLVEQSMGISFIRRKVEEYLNKNPIPRVKYSPRKLSNTIV